MRRILCVILLGALLLTMLSGCTSWEPSPESGSESRTASASEPLSPEDPFYEEVLRTLGLAAERDTLVGALPLGWKQRLAFSVATFHRPDIVFLDEPTGGVDPKTRRQFWELIYQAADQGITVFVTTHYMDEAEFCGRVSIMVDGRIRALDTPEGLKQTFGEKDMDGVFHRLAREATRNAD